MDKILKRKAPGELVIYRNGREIYFTDRELVDRFIGLVQKKKGKKIAQAGVNQIKKETILHFDYGYKEKGMWVATDGRIMFAVDKAEIRNRSLTGYIWWKAISDSRVNLYYVSEPDPGVAAAAHRLINKITSETY